MNILLLANAKNVHTVKWANGLVRKGHEVHLVFKHDDEPKENKISRDIILHRLKFAGTKGYYFNIYEFRNILKEVDPDVVNTHYASGYGTLARLSKTKKLVLSVWGSDVYNFPYKSKLNMKIIKKNLSYANKIASTSVIMAKQVAKLIPISIDDIAITPFGVDTAIFKRKKMNIKNKNIIIGNIKALEPVYGISDLIKSIKILKTSFESDGMKELSGKINVVIYGDGSQKEELIKLTKELGLLQTIDFKGKIPNSNVPNALENIDIFCVTSVQESFGVAVVEAMAMQVPVVATKIDGFEEVIVDGDSGILVNRGNIEEIAEALRKLILDEQLRNEMGINGRKRVLELYDWDKNIEMMESVYTKVK